MTTFVGSLRILRAMRPSDATAIIFLSTLGAIFAGRHYFEGAPYQVSYSAMIGDSIGFIYVILRAQEVLKRPRIYIPDLLQMREFHMVALSLSFLLGVLATVLTIHMRDGQIMDIYHDVFIAPMFLYLAITLVPVILCNGTRREMFEAGIYACLWVSLVIVDWSTGMIAQRIWLETHLHVVWPN